MVGFNNRLFIHHDYYLKKI